MTTATDLTTHPRTTRNPVEPPPADRHRARKTRTRTRSAPAANRTHNHETSPASADGDLVTVAGVVDIRDGHAALRTTGYLPGPSDQYISAAQVQAHGLRTGDILTGAAPTRPTGRRAALARIDTVNGLDASTPQLRPHFADLTPLYPQQQLHLESEAKELTSRVIDLIAPIGKGQRGLLVAPPKTGKTMVMQAIAAAITRNHPEAHLMVVLIDERPEEVTDMRRSVRGEVISSTFDRPAREHTALAELAVERAKRLVELGHDVVILLDSITRLARAYNAAAPSNGRTLSGGLDAAAIHHPKKLFGAARNIENGGSLTIVATALVETGSRMDDLVFEELKSTGNMELRLHRGLADKRLFPAVDVRASGTRREELLLGPARTSATWTLHGVLGGMDTQAATELLLDRLKRTGSNADLLRQVIANTPARP